MITLQSCPLEHFQQENRHNRKRRGYIAHQFDLALLLNWNLADGLESHFWASSTPSNTLFLTWQKVLPDRSPEKPITF